MIRHEQARQNMATEVALVAEQFAKNIRRLHDVPVYVLRYGDIPRYIQPFNGLEKRDIMKHVHMAQYETVGMVLTTLKRTINSKEILFSAQEVAKVMRYISRAYEQIEDYIMKHVKEPEKSEQKTEATAN